MKRLGWLGLALVGLAVGGCGGDDSSTDAEGAFDPSSAGAAGKSSDSKQSPPGGAGKGGSLSLSEGAGGSSAAGAAQNPGSAGSFSSAGSGGSNAFGGSSSGSDSNAFGTGGFGAAGAGSGEFGQAGGGGAPAAQPGAGSGGGSGQAGANAAGQGGDAGQSGQAGAGGKAELCAGIDLEKTTTLYLSADDSNSMASAALARRLLRSGQVPPPNLVRSYEFLNYYNVAYPPPAQGDLALVPQMRPGKTEGDYDLQIGVQSAPPVTPRRPLNLTLVLDTSGSMSGEPMVLMKAAVRALASQLRAGDKVSMTTWNTQTNIALSGLTVQGPNDPTLLAANQALSAGGGTNLYLGLTNGYDLARTHYSEDRTNRVVVISDGVANVGITEEQFIGKEADVENKEGIYLVGVGVGAGVNDTLLNVVTDAGNGAYIYLDSEEEAQRMLGNRFDEAMEIAARNVQVALTMPGYFAIAKFSGEQYSTDPAKVKPQHLAPGDAMVISQTLRSCDPSLVKPADPLDLKATWIEPGTWKQRSVEVKTSVGALAEQSDAQLRRGLAIVAYADALKKGYGCDARPKLVADAMAAVDAADPKKNDDAMNEIRDLLTTFDALCP